MIGIYDYTVYLTYINFICGIMGIICASEGNIFHAIVLLMVAGICDMFDGKVARRCKRTETEKND